MSLLKKVIISILLLFIGFVMTVFVISKVYQSEIIHYINQEMNTSFADQVHIEKLSDVTFLRSFPNLSISAQEVIVYELWDQKKKKILANIPNAHLEIDVWKLLQGQMVFPEISIKDAHIDLLHDEKRGYNFIQSSKEESNSSLFLHLEKITIQNSTIYWKEEDKLQRYTILAKDLIFNGLFAKDQYDVSIEGDFALLDYDSLPGISIRNIPLRIDAAAHVNTKNKEYTLSTCTLVLNNEIKAHAKGFVALDKEVSFDVQLEDVDLPKFLPFISDSVIKHQVNKFRFSGLVRSALLFRKDLKNNVIQDFLLKGSISNASFTHDSLSVTFDQVSSLFNLVYTDSLFALRIDSLEGKLMNGYFRSTISMPNIYKKEGIRAKVDFDLIPIQKVALLFPVADLEFLEGSLSGAFTFDSSKFSTRVHIENTALRYKAQEINTIQAKMFFKDQKLNIQELSGTLQNSPWFASGVVSWDTMSSSRHSFVLHLESIDLEPFIVLQNTEKKSIETNQKNEIQWPSMVGRVNINQLKYQKIVLNEVDVILDVQKDLIRFPSLRFKGFKGAVDGKALLRMDSLWQFQGECSFENMDVKQFLRSFDNFSQSYLTDAHLSGTVHGNTLFTIPFTKEGNVLLQKVEAQADWTIENGRLDQFEPLQEICTFIQQKKLYATFIDYKSMSQKFKAVQFQKMSNQLFIQKGRIHIPKMSVQSSALQFEVQGIHSFNDSIDYKLDFFLSDLLKKKESGLEDGMWEIKKEDKKWLKMYVGMNGTTNNPQFYIRKKETVDRMEEISKQEKSTIKSMLKTDFGMYSKDTTIQKYQNKPSQRQMQFEHPEFKKEPVQEKLPEEKKPKASPFLNTKPIEKEKEDYVPED